MREPFSMGVSKKYDGEARHWSLFTTGYDPLHDHERKARERSSSLPATRISERPEPAKPTRRAELVNQMTSDPSPRPQPPPAPFASASTISRVNVDMDTLNASLMARIPRHEDTRSTPLGDHSFSPATAPHRRSAYYAGDEVRRATVRARTVGRRNPQHEFEVVGRSDAPLWFSSTGPLPPQDPSLRYGHRDLDRQRRFYDRLHAGSSRYGASHCGELCWFGLEFVCVVLFVAFALQPLVCPCDSD